MNFEFPEKARRVQARLRRFLADEAPRERLRALVNDAQPFDAKFWGRLAGAGWLGSGAISSAFGGVRLQHAKSDRRWGCIASLREFGGHGAGPSEQFIWAQEEGGEPALHLPAEPRLDKDRPFREQGS